MHYCVYLFTEKKPTKEEIKKIMVPYAEPEAPSYAPISWDYYNIGGRFWNRLSTKAGFKCAGAPVSHLLECDDLVEGCYAFITPDGVVVPSEIWIWDNWTLNQNFKYQFKKAMEQFKNGYLTILDIHS